MLAIGDRRIPLDRDGTWSVGSSPAADVLVEDPSVAAVHALLHVEGQRVVVEDRSNGWTFVDGVEVTRRPLADGDRVVLGSVPVQITVSRSAVAPPPTEPSDPAAPPSPPPSAEFPSAATTAAAVQANPTSSIWNHKGNRPLRHEQSFGDLMADELQRAPWFAVSLVLHLLVLLLLLWLVPREERGGKTPIEFGLAGTAGPPVPEAIEPAEEPIHVLDPDPVELDEPDFEPHEDDTEEVVEEFVHSIHPGDLMTADVMTAKIAPRRPSDLAIPGGGGEDSGGFRETVAELRASGLELVFVFDSTGSMDHVLASAKARLVRTLDVLQALVPDARVGVVTYRDHGSGEEYLTRSVPLAADYYRAVNFVQSISADGGGDEPEAVFDGLQVAVDQPWRSGAKRVIVLVGDAEAQPRSMAPLVRLARRFSARGVARIHTVVTPRSRFGRPVASAMRNFEEIAGAGKGDAILFEDEASLLKQILTLAFGKEFRRNVDDVFAAVDAQRSQASAAAAQVVADPDAVLRALARDPVPHEVVQAAIEHPDKRTMLALIHSLDGRDLPEPGRHAAAYILQQVLDMPKPPVDPDAADLRVKHTMLLDLQRRVRQVFED